MGGDTGTQIAHCQVGSDAINGNKNWTLLKEEGGNSHKMENVNAKNNLLSELIRMKEIG